MLENGCFMIEIGLNRCIGITVEYERKSVTDAEEKQIDKLRFPPRFHRFLAFNAKTILPAFRL